MARGSLSTWRETPTKTTLLPTCRWHIRVISSLMIPLIKGAQILKKKYSLGLKLAGGHLEEEYTFQMGKNLQLQVF